MNEERRPQAPAEPARRDEPAPPRESAEHPAPGVEHKPEPDAENLVPVKHEPGTL